MPGFKRIYKKFSKQQKQFVDQAIVQLIQDPFIGEEKKGDLAGVFVYKFKMHHQQYLLAYQWDSSSRLLLALGVHENFYRDLKLLIPLTCL